MSDNERKPTTRATRGEMFRGQADEGVRWCMQLMTSSSWRTGVSDYQTAEQFGVSIHTARGWASDAARHLRLLMADSEEMRARIAVMLEDLHARALEGGDLKAGVAALSKQAELLGLVDRSPKVAVQVNVEQYAQLDDASMLDKVDAQIAKLTQVRARLLAKQAITMPALPAKEDDDG
jgi:hypothetical protein